MVDPEKISWSIQRKSFSRSIQKKIHSRSRTKSIVDSGILFPCSIQKKCMVYPKKNSMVGPGILNPLFDQEKTAWSDPRKNSIGRARKKYTVDPDSAWNYAIPTSVMPCTFSLTLPGQAKWLTGSHSQSTPPPVFPSDTICFRPSYMRAPAVAVFSPKISPDFHRSIKLHTGARVNVVLLTYLHFKKRIKNSKLHYKLAFSVYYIIQLSTDVLFST